ncbi:hypothetical protein JHK84_027535 [Glycine max]|nr:hypothetical protein JHK87_027189 [Glycine soja]KAG4996487.1 hypothetical protein JHK85_027926 [Glycine max]KAG5151063.1 hypothetical protein JHK84_027535 [Glycine max]
MTFLYINASVKSMTKIGLCSSSWLSFASPIVRIPTTLSHHNGDVLMTEPGCVRGQGILGFSFASFSFCWINYQSKLYYCFLVAETMLFNF